MPEDLVQTFKELKVLLKKYENPLKPRIDLDRRYDLWSEKEVEIAGRKRNEVHFAALIIQSNYVGFYFMPVYANLELKSVFGLELLKTLKGKSCFHINTLDEKLKKQIEFALKKGFDLYKKRGWV